MIEFYDASGEPHLITDYENYSITHMLDGCDVLSFCLDVRHEQYKMLYEEARIVANGNEWLIKKIDDDRIDCELNFDFLKSTYYDKFESESLPLQVQLEQHLPEGWVIVGGSVSSIRRTIKFDHCTDFDIVYQCMSTYGVRFVWDIPKKKVTVYNPELMQPTGEYLTSELNLRALTYKGDTTDFCTRLYAYGKDGMTMEEAIVDGSRYGLKYVENKSYIDKTICAYWVDERYEVPENLHEAALKKLETLSYPVRSYECSVIDLAKQNEQYTFLDFRMHKKITLIDVERGIRVEHQIVEYKEFPDEPDSNVVILSCVPPTIKTGITSAVSTAIEVSEKMKTDLDARIMMATAMLTGAFGGYTLAREGEFLILDNPDPAQAMTVWRWNINGFGKSSTGIDGPYTSALTFDDNFVTSVITAMVIRGAYIEAGSIQTEALSQSYKQSVTDEITGECAEVRQEFRVADGLLESEISKKVGNDEFGTKITQNWESVQIAWNNISQYIAFEGGEIRIKDTNDYPLMYMTTNGAWYYHEGRTIGCIGTNHFINDDSFRGLTFDLESGADYMAWSQWDGEGYRVKLVWYSTTCAYGSGGFHFEDDVFFLNGAKMGADLDMDGHDILNESDARLKTKIAPAESSAIEKLKRIDMFSFDWIESGEHCDIGFIAQQLQEVLPELVKEEESSGKLAIRMMQFIPMLVKGIQELSNQVEEMSGSKKKSGKKRKVAWTDKYTEEEKSSFIGGIRKHFKESPARPKSKPKKKKP